MIKKNIQHLYWRASFGISPKLLEQLTLVSRLEVVNNLFEDSKQVTPLKVDTVLFNNLTKEAYFKNSKKKREYQDKSIEKIKELNLAWIDRMATNSGLLREKMTLFWANHFVSRDNQILYTQKFNNRLREYALGNFGDFVKAISKEASMINYLDLKQNRRENPNENFSRELMELFALGVGHYTDEDVKESAKAFTGYNYEFHGQFKFNEKQHNSDYKFFFGKAGKYDGDDIIDMILEKKQCAHFICEKLYRYFVNETIVDNHIEELVAVFYPNYEISEVMHYLFMADWFYNAENCGTKIKSPIELLVGIQKLVSVTFKNPIQALRIQRLLGQTLLYPPNVAGWEGNQAWINTNTLLMRLKLPSLLLNDGFISTKENGLIKDKNQKYYSKNASNKFTNTKVDWRFFNEEYRHLSLSEMKNMILATSIKKETANYLKQLERISAKDQCIQLMSLPEYQMC